MDAFLLAAMQEVDEMLPGTPRISPPPAIPRVYEMQIQNQVQAEMNRTRYEAMRNQHAPRSDINGFRWNDCTYQWIHPSGRKVSGVEVDFHGPAVLFQKESP